MVDAGLESLCWITEIQKSDSAGRHFVPIGSNGFYEKNGKRARFDQQPIEAQQWYQPVLKLTELQMTKNG